MISNLVCFSAALLMGSTLAHSKDEWKSRTIYQLLTDRFYRTDNSSAPCPDITKYCGGTFKGIENKLSYIKGMGFDAIWISPIPENYGNDYHGYGALNWTNVNPHFGDSDSLKSMIKTAQSMGIWVMLDVVANHVAYIDEQYSLVTPFNDVKYYHTKCQINNWNDQNEVEQCRLSNLPDLNQDNQFVRDYLKNWVKDVVQTFNFDGLRVDTVPEVKPAFWKEYSTSAGTFTIGEVFNGDIGYVSNYANNALDATMNYPLYFVLKSVFNYKQSMYNIRTTLANEKNAFHDMDALGLFIDNHDNARFLSITPNWPLFKAGLTFVTFAQGIPIIYYGSEQAFAGGNDPQNREALWTSMNTQHPLYLYITQINSIRKQYQVWNSPHIERWCDDSFYAFTRGNVLIALTNNPDTTQHRDITYHPFAPGTKLCNLLNTSDCLNVTSDNRIPLYLNSGEAKIYAPSTGTEEGFLQES